MVIFYLQFLAFSFTSSGFQELNSIYIIIYLGLTLLNRFLGFPQIAITIANYVINAIIGPISPIYMVLLYKNLKAVKNSGSLNVQ